MQRWVTEVQIYRIHTLVTIVFRDDHQVECRIFSLLRAKLKRNKDGERLYRANLSGLTSSVTCVRMLSLKWRYGTM